MTEYYLYKFLDKKETVLYVGQTVNLKKRLKNTHFTPSGHLPRECYISTNKVLISKVNNTDEMNIYERYLINILNPVYNTQSNNKSEFEFELPDLEWVEYDFNLSIPNNYEEKVIEYTIEDFYADNGLANREEVIDFNIEKYLLLNTITYNKSRRKPLACIDLRSLECVDVFRNADEAGDRVIAYPGNIGNAARLGKTCAGYMWRYIDKHLIKINNKRLGIS